LGEIGTNTSHVLGTAEPPGTTGPAGAAGPAPWRVPGPKHRLSHEHNLDERYSLRKQWFDQMVESRITWINGSTYSVTQPPQPSSRGAILGVPEHSWCITQHGGGLADPSTCVSGETDPWNRPTTASGVVIKGVQGERRHIPGLAAHSMWPPCAPTTFLVYKSHLPLAGSKTQRRSISISLFCSLRVGLV
jgi:hypothetical protein